MPSDSKLSAASRVLIYRLGSLGDTVIALPCFHLIARSFPQAERILLTNIPINAKAPAAAAVLGDSGLVHRYIHYPVGTRNPIRLGQLALQVRSLGADVLVYLAAPRGEAAVQRDARFFRLCGFRSIYGLPAGDLGINQLDPETGLLEAESHRLARTLASLGDARIDDPASWDFCLTHEEKSSALVSLQAIGNLPYIVCAPGCKAPANDWEDCNWAALFEQLSSRLAGRYALVLTGAESDRPRNDRLRAHWQGPSLNLCGNTPREAAAVLGRASLYLGPDSGPMHIAAAVGTACVAVFSARLGLGIWFPHGSQRAGTRQRVLFNRTECSPCHLEICTVEKKRCILSITPEEVLRVALELLPVSN
jgi:ADP-heptose:LPS heptosyltransferase